MLRKEIKRLTFKLGMELASQLKGGRGKSHIQFKLLFLLSQEVIAPADIIVNISGPVFSGLVEADRNILDPNLEKTLKEYAKIDGSFIIRDDGTLIPRNFSRGLVQGIPQPRE